MAPASPLLSPPNDFRHDSAAASPYATAPSSPRGRAGAALFLTAPPSPNPFVDVLSSSPSTPRLTTTTTTADPFDLFHHFASAPASPRRAAAIYAHFAAEGEDRDDDEEEEFQPRGSYATSVPFDWEERPGTPKAGLGGGATAAWDDDDADFEFGTFAADKSAPAQELLTTADELFDKGRIRPTKPFLRTAEKIRPLKPPPGLLDGGSSVGSSPRSPLARGGTTRSSPRRQNRVGSGVDFDPFAAALLEATKAAPSPSPLGTKDANANANASGSPPEKPTPRRPAPSSRSAGWRRWWRLSDLLMFRSSSDAAGRASNKDPISFFKSSPAPQPDPSVTKTFAQQATATGNKAASSNRRTAAAAADDVAGCARLSPLQRLTKGLGGYSSWHNHGRGMTTAPGTTTTTKG